MSSAKSSSPSRRTGLPFVGSVILTLWVTWVCIGCGSLLGVDFDAIPQDPEGRDASVDARVNVDEAEPDKVCDGRRVSKDEPAFGCASASCAACSMVHAAGSCRDGTCVRGLCDDGYDDCDGRSETGCEVQLASDKNHCGGCGRACSANQVCNRGSCADSCSPGLTACDGSCVDLASNTDHCQRCGNACPLPSNGTATCEAGVCRIHCNLGYQACGNSCCKIGSDACAPQCSGKSCGSGDGCGGRCQTGICPANAQCSSGSCTCLHESCSTTCCAPGEVCGQLGSCCRPQCAGRQCGKDPVCGTSCGAQCPNGQTCDYRGQCTSVVMSEIMIAAVEGTTGSGNLGGLAGADAKCASEAAAAGVAGTWKAFLCASSRRVDTLFTGAAADVPVVNIRHEPLYPEFSCFLTAYPSTVSVLTFRGAASTADAAWSGCSRCGVPNSACDDWTASSCAKSGTASFANQRMLSPNGSGCCSVGHFTFFCVRVAE